MGFQETATADYIERFLREQELCPVRVADTSVVATLTSNRPFQEWAALFDDAVVVSAILDRLLHHAHLVNLKGDSYRLKDTLHSPDVRGVEAPTRG